MKKINYLDSIIRPIITEKATILSEQNKTVFKVLGAMQNAYYRSDERRERFVSLCNDIDVQKITFESSNNNRCKKTYFWRINL